MLEQTAVSNASRVVGRPQGQVDQMRAEQLRCAEGARLGYCHNDAKLKAPKCAIETRRTRGYRLVDAVLALKDTLLGWKSYYGVAEVDDQGNRTAIILAIAEYEKLMEEIEELEAIRAYDAALSSGDEAIPFEQAVNEIEHPRQ